MKAIILAAGQGTRLRPFTDDRPKCLVEYQRKPILDYILDSMHQCNLNDITVVRGYMAEKINRPHLKYYANERYATTNMVETLFSAETELTGDVVISYADIIYRPSVLKELMEAPVEIGVVVDRQWQKLWRARMEDPLADAETMKIGADNNIIELGKKPKSLKEIEGQYIGLIKFSAETTGAVRDFYHGLDRTITYDGKPFEKMYMTSFIQLIIDRLMPVKAVFIDGGWLEIDAPSDLNLTNLI